MDNQEYKKQLNLFARISFLEGSSFVGFLLIAMPLKYALDLPQMVKYVGWAHGALFIAYGFQLLYIGYTYKWQFSKVGLYGICSLIPFAPFWVEKQMEKEISSI